VQSYLGNNQLTPELSRRRMTMLKISRERLTMLKDILERAEQFEESSGRKVDNEQKKNDGQRYFGES
jgi:hypothetical protein